MSSQAIERIVGIDILLCVITHQRDFLRVAADLRGHFRVRVRLEKEVARHPLAGAACSKLASRAPWTLCDRAFGRPRSHEVLEFLHLWPRGTAHLCPRGSGNYHQKRYQGDSSIHVCSFEGLAM